MQAYIDSAVEKFRELLTEQLARQEKIAKGSKAKDFANMEKIVIGVCGGDGIGPIITREGERVLRYLLKDTLLPIIPVTTPMTTKKKARFTATSEKGSTVIIICIPSDMEVSI